MACLKVAKQIGFSLILKQHFVKQIKCNRQSLTLVNQCPDYLGVVVVREKALTNRCQQPEGLLFTNVQQQNTGHDVHSLTVAYSK